MSILDDLADAIQAYPRDHLTLEIFGVDAPGSTGVIDEDDDVTFDIRVTNTGVLDVKQLSLLVEGLHGTEVKSNGAAAQWASSFTIDGSYFGDIVARNPDVSVEKYNFHFRPTSPSPSVVKDLVKVSVATWDTDFVHMQNAFSTPAPNANAVYSSTVSAA
jgi:hypothetical protein